MPVRNVVKVYAPDSYYHLYTRGWNSSKIFLDEDDYLYFEQLLARHLSAHPKHDKKGREYTQHYPAVKLNAYCLMGNHLHLLVYQRDEQAIVHLAKSLFVAYTMYFNKKYKRRGALFESTYKAVRMQSDEQLMHITRYIHLNHSRYREWRHSSYQDYLCDSPRDFIFPAQILGLFHSCRQYEVFVADYEALQRTRDAIKRELSAE
jgi:putative transposase